MSDFIRQLRGPMQHEIDSLSNAQRDFTRPKGFNLLVNDLLYRADTNPTPTTKIPHSARNPERGVLPPAPEESGYDPMLPNRTTRKI